MGGSLAGAVARASASAALMSAAISAGPRQGILPAAVFLAVVTTQLWLVAAAGTDIPFHDQWNIEGSWLYPGWNEGSVHAIDLIKPFNEHRFFWTHLLNLVLFKLDGQWDPLVQLTAGAGLRAGCAGVLTWLFGRGLGWRGSVAVGRRDFRVPAASCLAHRAVGDSVACVFRSWIFDFEHGFARCRGSFALADFERGGCGNFGVAGDGTGSARADHVARAGWRTAGRIPDVGSNDLDTNVASAGFAGGRIGIARKSSGTCSG